MKKKYMQIAAGITALVLSAGFTYYFADSRNNDTISADTELTETVAQNEPYAVKTDSALTATKAETVYVNADASGNTEQIIVSDWLKNPDSAGVIEDISNLSDIKNVKGNEGFSNEDGKLTWNANGSDIYYQGYSSEQLPVSMNITYKLDGKDISAKDLAGKSGKVTMRFDYTNNESRTINVNGTDYTVNVPFLVATGMILDSDKFANIEVTNGTVVSDGKNCFVLGGAMPGLSESLDLDSFSSDEIDLSDIDIPEYFEVTADVADFSLSTTLTMVSGDLFNELDLDASSSIDDLKSTIKDLSDASTKLVDGSSDLYDGIKELLDKSGELTDGINQLADGSSELCNGTKTLADGAAKLYDGAGTLKSGSDQLADGAAALAEGADTLADGSKTLTAGASSLADGAAEANSGAAALADGAASLKSGTSQLSEGAAALAGGTSSLKDGAEQVDSGSASLQDGIAQINSGISQLDSNSPALVKGSSQFNDGMQQLKAALADTEADVSRVAELVNASSQIKAAIQQLSDGAALLGQNLSSDAMKSAMLEQGLDTDALQAGNAQCIETISAQLQTLSSQLEQISGIEGYEEQAAQLQAQIESLTQIVTLLNGNNAYITGSQTYIDTVGQSASQLISGISQLSESYAQFDSAVNTLASELDKMSESIVQLRQAVNQLADAYSSVDIGINSYTTGVKALLDGTDKLSAGSDALKTGTSSLYSGAKEVNTGAETLYQGIVSLDSGAGTLSDGAAALSAGTKTLSDGAYSLLTGASNLSDGAASVSSGAASLKSGASSLSGGASTLYSSLETLKTGSESLQSGASQLYDGIGSLQSGGNALIEGIQKLHDGSKELKDGMAEFDREGIRKIADIVNKDMVSITDRITALENASDDYKSFSGLSDSMDGTVKFIIETAEINND